MHYYFGSNSKILHHQFVILLSTMQKPAQTPSRPQGHAKFPKSTSFSSVGTQAQFSIEKISFSRKVSEQQKQTLVELITYNNYNMMDAAKAVKISYSSAKKIFTRFRRNLKEQTRRKNEELGCTIRATYSFVKSDSSMQATLVNCVSLIAGKQQNGEGEKEMLEEMDC